MAAEVFPTGKLNIPNELGGRRRRDLSRPLADRLVQVLLALGCFVEKTGDDAETKQEAERCGYLISINLSAAKSHWLPGGLSLDFTPIDGSTNARAMCTSAVARQGRNGYILDYARHRPTPSGVRERSRIPPGPGATCPGCRSADCRSPFRPGSGRSQREIIGNAAFERLQDMWAQDGNRVRWSVAFPIVESYNIENPPYARDVFGAAAYQVSLRTPTIERIPEDAARIGPATPAVCEQILDHRPHPNKGYRAVLA